MAEVERNTMWCGMCSTRLPADCFYRSNTNSCGMLPRCKSCRRNSARALRHADPEAYRATQRARVRDPKKAQATQKVWRENHRKLAQERSAASRLKKLEEYNARMRAYKKAFPELVRAQDAKRRARILGASGTGWTAADVEALKVLQRNQCAICRDKLKRRFHRDHIIPLKLGGAHDRKNLQLLCEPCNLSKGARHPIDHSRSLGLLL
jgi:5-methylcytosine-specific restriction endonuclease McrA